MKRRGVFLAPRAEADLDLIGAWIAEQGAPLTALAFVARIRARIASLAEFADRGTDHGRLRSGLRTLVAGNGVVIAYAVRDAHIEVERVFSRGQDWRRALDFDNHDED